MDWGNENYLIDSSLSSLLVGVLIQFQSVSIRFLFQRRVDGGSSGKGVVVGVECLGRGRGGGSLRCPTNTSGEKKVQPLACTLQGVHALCKSGLNAGG
jgi:hypothetical protein